MKHFCLALLVAVLIVPGALAHKKHAKIEKAPLPPEAERERRLVQINDAYVARIKPIFVNKCFDCHSEQTNFPWYYKIPGVKQFIDADIAEAKEHMEMSHDFPFRGHGKPEEDLDGIVKSMADGDMPPWYYRILHSGSRVTADEAKQIVTWAKESRELLFWEKK